MFRYYHFTQLLFSDDIIFFHKGEKEQTKKSVIYKPKKS